MPPIAPRTGARSHDRTRARGDAFVALIVFGGIVAPTAPKPGTRLGLGDRSGASLVAGRSGARARAAAPRPGAAPARTPIALLSRRHPAATAPAAPRVDLQRAAFAFDLAATGRVMPDRADALAELAVRQARAHDLPPALIFGVLLVENEDFNSRARSSAGALGLMQVHPLWRPLLGHRYGYNLTADSTNLAMGAHILAEHLDEARTAGDVEQGLLRYNGCRSAFAPTAAERARRDKPPPCAAYAARVRRRVEQEAGALCPSHSFSRCVVRPLRLAALPRIAAARKLAAAQRRAAAERQLASAQRSTVTPSRRGE
jgi:hypothetical protein